MRKGKYTLEKTNYTGVTRKLDEQGDLVGFFAQPSFKSSRKNMPAKTFDKVEQAVEYVAMYVNAAKEGRLDALNALMEARASVTMRTIYKCCMEDPKGWLSNTSETQPKNAVVFCDWFGWRRNPRDITRKTIRDFFEHRREVKNASNTTLNRYLSAISMMFKSAVREGLIEPEVLMKPNDMRLPEDKSGRTRESLTEDHYLQLLEASQHLPTEDRLIVLMMSYYGRRSGEFVAMQMGDIKFDMGKHGAIRFLNSKGRYARNEVFIPIFPAVKPTLCVWVKMREEQGAKGSDPFWLTYTNTAIIRDFLKDLSTDKIEHTITPHWMRHTCLTRMVDRGASPRMVQQYAGHKSLATTEGYFRSRPEAFDGIVDIMDPDDD